MRGWIPFALFVLLVSIWITDITSAPLRLPTSLRVGDIRRNTSDAPSDFSYNQSPRTIDYTGTLLRINGTSYILTKALGKGGFGVSYLTNSSLNAPPLVIKISYLSKKEDTEKRQRLGWDDSQESGILKKLGLFRGEGVMFRLPFTIPYLAMQFIKGHNILRLIQSKTLNSTCHLRLFRDAAHAALVHLHETGIAHQDIHEGNVIFRFDPAFKNITATFIDYGSSTEAETTNAVRFYFKKLFDWIMFEYIFKKSWMFVRKTFGLTEIQTRKRQYFIFR